MVMIHTKPYAYINISVVDAIMELNGKYFLIDKCGKWEISFEDFDYLESRGIKRYVRKCPTTESL